MTVAHFYGHSMEAGFYRDAVRVVGSVMKLSNVQQGLVSGWVTMMLDFMEDLVSTTFSLIEAVQLTFA